MCEKTAYSRAFRTGKYDKSSGLLGKYDNVRRFWEDRVSGFFLGPALQDLVERKRQGLEGIRILDIGCGSGDGYDLLTGVTAKDPGAYEYVVSVIPPEMLQEYVGLDLNPDLLRQAEEHYGHLPKVRFLEGDMSDGLPEEIQSEAPFDIYFSSYGTLSHFNDKQCAKIIADICTHSNDRAVFIGDWLGRYSYEWQDLWHHPGDEECFMDYRISYLYPEEVRTAMEIPSFPLRLMTRDEIEHIIEQAGEMSGTQIRPLDFFDRSILIGRHMDTAEYNANCRPLRMAVNSLFEGYLRTDLEGLLVDYAPRRGFERLNGFFEMFFLSWNTVIRHTIFLLSHHGSETERFAGEAQGILPLCPDPLKEAMRTMQRVIEGIGWLPWGDVRANVIEPCLGYSLRKLEMDLQPGTGAGHGIVGIFEIQK